MISLHNLFRPLVRGRGWRRHGSLPLFEHNSTVLPGHRAKSRNTKWHLRCFRRPAVGRAQSSTPLGTIKACELPLCDTVEFYPTVLNSKTTSFSTLFSHF